MKSRGGSLFADGEMGAMAVQIYQILPCAVHQKASDTPMAAADSTYAHGGGGGGGGSSSCDATAVGRRSLVKLNNTG